MGDAIRFPSLYAAPWRLFAATIPGIFIAGVIAIAAACALKPGPAYPTALLGAGILTLLTLPVLYFLTFRPMFVFLSKRRQFERALREKDELQERFFNSIDTLIAYMDRDFNFIRVNDAYARAGGLQVEHFTDKNHFELYPHRENQEIFQRVVETGEPYVVHEKPFEYPEQPGRGVTYWNWNLQPVKDMNGEVEGLVLSLVDVTERKRAEDELRSAHNELEMRVQERTEELRLANIELQEEIAERRRAAAELRYQATLLSNVNDAIIASDARYRITAWNAAAEAMYGWKASEVLGQNGLEIIRTEWPEQDAEEMRQVIRKTGRWLGEATQVRRDGSRFPVEVSSIVLYSSDGQNAGYVSVNRDITERKQAEEALRQSEERYRSLFNSMTEGFALHEILCDDAGVPCDYRFLEINRSFETLTGLERHAVIGRTVKAVLPGIEALWIEIFGRVALTGQPAHFDSYSKDLNRHYDVYAYCPAPRQFAAVFMDVTERRRAEQELFAANQRLAALMSALPVGVSFSQDTTCQQISGNPAVLAQFEVMSGANLSASAADPEVSGRKVRYFYNGRELTDSELPLQRAVAENREIPPIELEIHLPSGRRWIAQSTGAPIRDRDGQVVAGVAVTVDITARKQAEQALRAARDELELRVQERTKELENTNRELLNEINERREVEQRLRVQTTALESAANGVIITGRHGNIRWANPAFLDMTGYSMEDVLGQNPRLLQSGQQEPEFYQNLWDTVLAGKVWRGELVNRRKDGSLYFEEQTITPLLDENGVISNFIAIKQDVTERKQAQVELERRNLELESLSVLEHEQRQIADTLRASAQGLAQTLDLDAVLHTLIRYVRSLTQSDTASVVLREGETLFAVRAVDGFENEAIINKITALKMDGESDPFYQRLMLTRRSLLVPDTANEPAWNTYPGTEPIRSCLLTPIVAEEKIIGAVVLGKLETDYFTEEHIQWAEALVGQAAVAIQNAWLFEQVRAGRERLQSLSRRLVEVQETERRFIARELHDHAGQTLTCLILGLGALERDALDPERVRAHAAGLKDLTHNVLRDLHRLAVSLRPASLDQLGLVPALGQMIESFAQNSSVQIRFKAVGISEDDRLPHEVETTLYRIAQEALTNVIRHAGAQRADVMLELRGETAIILVEDDGKGFDVDGAKISGPLGLLGMQERAEMLGGTLTVESAAGKGTTLVVEVPYVNPNYDRG